MYVNIDNVNANYKTLTLVTDTGTQNIVSTSLGGADAQTNVWAKFENHPGTVISFSIGRTDGVGNNIFGFKADGNFLVDKGNIGGAGFYLPFDPAAEGGWNAGVHASGSPASGTALQCHRWRPVNNG